MLERLAPKKLPLPPMKALPANGLARTPPMGFSTWNHFQTKIDDRTIRDVADALVATGMRDAGYVYVNIDDGWQGDRDEHGVIRPNEKFPDMKALADYLHERGLKLGIYTVARTEELRRLRRQLRPRGAGRADVRRMGRRLPQVRLVQRRADLRRCRDAGGVSEDGGGDPRHRPADGVQHLPVRTRRRLEMGR